LDIEDAAGLGLAGPLDADLHEWRCLPPAGGFHDWERYPALAQAVADWIGRTAAGQDGTLLLGLLVPQEVAVGIGVLAGGAAEHRWPRHLWPVHFGRAEGRLRLVIPGLDLGWRSLHPSG
jgi:hypothetical protein